jgi:hypothetical protein
MAAEEIGCRRLEMADKLDVFLTICSDALQAEEEAKERLTGGAEKYLVVIGVILGFHVVELKEMTFSGGGLRAGYSLVAVVGLGLLFAALVLVLLAMRVRAYPAFPKSKDLHSVVTAASDDLAKRLAANVYLDLRDGIKTVNEKRALTFKIAGYMLLAGFLLSVLGQLGLGLKLW